eukprot:7381091-Prymnesium_polylepis.3
MTERHLYTPHWGKFAPEVERCNDYLQQDHGKTEEHKEEVYTLGQTTKRVSLCARHNEGCAFGFSASPFAVSPRPNVKQTSADVEQALISRTLK